MAVSKRLRYEILRRDNHACRYCGQSAPDVRLTIDHVVPVALGGGDDPSNLVAACVDCNAGKASVAAGGSLVADVASDAARWADALRDVAATQREAWKSEREERERRTKHLADQWDQWVNGYGETAPRPGDWERSVENWYSSGATDEDIDHAIGIAMRAQKSSDITWRYFCGVMWRVLRERQQAARDLLTVEDGHDVP